MLENLPLVPPDPILGIAAAYQEDPNPLKVDLGIGVYKDESGKTPILACVRDAESRVMAGEQSKSYAAALGEQSFNTRIEALVFGENHAALRQGRVSTAQTPGGCGALRVAAELILRAKPKATLWVSDPTWGNHAPLLGNSGLHIEHYPYYDYSQHQVRFEEMLASLKQTGPEDLVLFHACCHNPAGADLTQEQWLAVAELAEQRGFTPFIDMAYQGFSQGLNEDAFGVRLLAERLPEVIVVNSCSKNFALYRERTGSISVISADGKTTKVVKSQLASVIRGIYSTPPTHGASIVNEILSDEGLRSLWLKELDGMRNRINRLRLDFANRLKQHGAPADFSFIAEQRGMFSFLGVSAQQAQRLRQEYSIYLLDSSRINIAGINASNLDYLCQSVIEVL